MSKTKAAEQTEPVRIVHPGSGYQEGDYDRQTQPAGEPTRVIDALPPESKPAIAWLPLDQAPKNGTPVYLKGGDGEPIECYWYGTRRIENAKWVTTGWWTIRHAARQPIDWEPEGFVWLK